MANEIYIQVSITGYSDNPATVYCIYDNASRILLVQKRSTYARERRKENFVLISNDQAAPRDWLFTSADLFASINAYYALQNGISQDGRTARLAFSDTTADLNPSSFIETDGIDPKAGQKYRLRSTISNAQMAVLAACLYAVRADTVADTVEMMQDFNKVLQGFPMFIEV